MPDAEQRKRRAVNRDSEVCQNLHEFLVVIVSAIIAHNKTMQTGYPLSVAQSPTASDRYARILCARYRRRWVNWTEWT